MSKYHIKLSKFLSYLLRHAAPEHDLKIDKKGYTDLEKVLGILNSKFKYFKKEDLIDLIKDDPKGRFEITSDKIRATYGHSMKVLPKAEPSVPPDILYHGTSSEKSKIILREGLRPMGRRFAHLSLNPEDAYVVGRRHAENPVILKIMAKKASAKGVKFYREKHVFMADFVPGEYIRL